MATLLERLKKEEVPPQVAGEMNRVFANMIRSCQVQINYALARGDKPHVDMLDLPSSEPGTVQLSRNRKQAMAA